MIKGENKLKFVITLKLTLRIEVKMTDLFYQLKIALIVLIETINKAYNFYSRRVLSYNEMPSLFSVFWITLQTFLSKKITIFNLLMSGQLIFQCKVWKMKFICLFNSVWYFKINLSFTETKLNLAHHVPSFKLSANRSLILTFACLWNK
ncbi:hypothetical protein BpHYR1_030563 [Brachionus plicatilis]|uniref:Uncharacterized protein n=1 Tax=Brachionus plicatilis TaxID=10195 RepID=A0A3M7SRF6_BRAPC|nr:hypothetical protein BpHYR1_030563 [Brachionus plicatilis]